MAKAKRRGSVPGDALPAWLQGLEGDLEQHNSLGFSISGLVYPVPLAASSTDTGVAPRKQKDMYLVSVPADTKLPNGPRMELCLGSKNIKFAKVVLRILSVRHYVLLS